MPNSSVRQRTPNFAWLRAPDMSHREFLIIKRFFQLRLRHKPAVNRFHKFCIGKRCTRQFALHSIAAVGVFFEVYDVSFHRRTGDLR